MQQTTNQGYNLVENIDEIQTSLNAWNANFNKIDADVTKLQTNIKVLEDNFDTATTSNSNNFVLEDSASGYIPRDDEGNPREIKIGDGPELEQDSPLVYKCNGTESGDYYFVYNRINYQFTMPTIEADNLLEFNTSTLVLSLNGTVIETTEASTGTLITLVQTPNPDYSQNITVVEGSSSVGVSNENLFPITLTSGTYNGLNVTVNQDKSITLSGTATSTINLVLFDNQNVALKGTYSWAYIGKTTNINLQGTINGENNYILFRRNNTSEYINNQTYDTVFKKAFINITNDSLFDNLTIKFMLLKKNSAEDVPYIPHKGQTYPITLPEGMFLGSIGTASNYIKGTKDNWKLVSGLGKHIFDGSENILYSGTGNWTFRYTPTPAIKTTISSTYANVLCDYFKGKASGSDLAITDYDNKICFRYDLYKDGSSASFKTWLATAKPEVYYLLETPTETPITDTTLIAQLNNIADNLQTYKGQTVVFTTSDNLEPNIQFDYMVNPLASIEARLDLLEA